MPDKDKLREHAAAIMARLEDTHDIALGIQGHGTPLSDMVTGFQAIRQNLKSIDKIASDAETLASKLRSP